jgi:peptidoglycan hydrolase CwlO-like protein
MRTFLIAMILMIIPFFSNAQSFNSSKMQPRTNPLPMEDERPPQLVQLPTMKPISINRVEKAQAKLTREEQKLIKLARKAWDQEDDLKKEQEQLKNLEYDPKSSNDLNHQKKIEKLKQQIVKSQEKLNKTKAEVESESKKVENLEKAIETAKYTRQGS